MEKLSYTEKLRDPRWQRKRLDIFNRDDFTCQKCGDKETNLQVHHKKYINGIEPWEYNNDDLETWCEDCHELVSTFKKDTKFLVGINDDEIKILKYKSTIRKDSFALFTSIEGWANISVCIDGEIKGYSLVGNDKIKSVINFLKHSIIKKRK